MIDQDIQEYDCIIVGAGAAGVAAAFTLHKQNYSYLVLEAQLRIGGRLQSEIIDDVKLDLGGCWIHSYSCNNPLMPIIQMFQIPQCSLTGPRTRGRVFIDGQTHLQIDEQILQYAQYNAAYFNTAVQKKINSVNTDLSIHEAASQFYQNRGNISGAQKRCTQAMINMKQHYEASSIFEMSAKYSDYQEDEGGDYFPEGTYATVIKRLAQCLNIQLNKIVQSIERTNQSIIVRCSDSSIYRSKQIIVSLPLGVLKSQSVKFVPDLPQSHRQAIERIGNGLMNKIILSFDRNFWGQVYWITVACEERGRFPHFYDLSQNGKHILCCFVTDQFAQKIQAMQDDVIIKQILDLLKNIFGRNNVNLREARITRWGSDKFSQGSYSSFHVGSSPNDCYNLRSPIQERMYFVGEHCYAEHLGTAHGAYQTGLWAAENILQKWVNPIFLQPMSMMD